MNISDWNIIDGKKIQLVHGVPYKSTTAFNVLKTFYDKSQLSTSVITPDNTNTYSPVGFILKAETTQVERMLPEAGGTNADNLVTSMGGTIKEGVISIAELLSQTPPKSFNEVIVSKPVSTEAIFIKRYSDGTLVSQEAEKMAEDLSRMLHIPLIVINENDVNSPVTLVKESANILKRPAYLHAVNNGRVLNIELAEDSTIYPHFREGFSKPMNPKDFAFMIEEVSKLPPADLQKININRLKERFNQQQKSSPNIGALNIAKSFLR